MGQVNKEWIISPPWAECEGAARRWGLSPLVAQVLYNRGVIGHHRPDDFLNPQLKNLFPPEQLPGTEFAAELIVSAIRDKKRIVIYGDYDVDGMTALAILWHLLKLAGAQASFYVPHRLEEGYGLNSEAVRSLLADGAEVIITVDCGITGIEAARVVAEAGQTLIITDHHQPGVQIPQAAAIVHPTVGGSYPNPDLCGAGVAFKLAWSVARNLSGGVRVDDQYRSFLHEAVALAALGTLADVVPLVGENRVIARHGLALLPKTPFVGLRVLMESIGLKNEKLGDYDVGFKLAPRLNAAGRMGHARLAVELLTRADESRAREIALYLDEQNRKRQSTERKITREACELVDRSELASDARRGIVLAGEKWHAGVIGIVASRMVERYHRPTVMIALNNGHGQGSARSVRHFDINEALGRCSEHLIEHGGHAMAAGLKIESSRVSAFTESFVATANQRLTGADLRDRLWIDAQVELSALKLDTVEALTGLGPFGVGNARPKLASDWVELHSEPQCVGSTRRHVQAVFTDGQTVVKSIAFGQSDMIDDLKRFRRCKVAFMPIINEFNGRRSVEMQVLDVQFPTS